MPFTKKSPSAGVRTVTGENCRKVVVIGLNCKAGQNSEGLVEFKELQSQDCEFMVGMGYLLFIYLFFHAGFCT